MASATRAGSTSAGRQSLIDIKGLGKPPVFKNDSSKFTERLRKTTGFLIAAYGSSFRQVIEWIEDQEATITEQDLDEQFGDTGHEPVEGITERNAQLHVALLALTEGESFDVVLGAAPSGLEALRRLVRRWDPLSGGRRRALLRQILVPDRCKLQELPAGLERWEELVRRYEKRRAGGMPTAVLDDDVKTAALEALVPGDLEQHLAMNRSRLSTYQQVRSEIQAFIEARRSQFALKDQGKKHPDTMDVDIFVRHDGGRGKGKGNGKGGKGKGSGKASGKDRVADTGTERDKNLECWTCGKRGHRSADCRQKSNRPSASSGSGEFRSTKGRGKGKDKHGGKSSRGRGTYCLDEEQCGQDEMPQPALAGSLELGSFGPDLPLEQRRPHLDADGWLRWTYDIGAAITAFPLDR